jgi:hypothetical protein
MNLTATSLQLEMDRLTEADPQLIVDFPIQLPGPGYDEIIDWLKPAPHGTALLGLCQDGLPLLIDLSGMEPGGLILLDRRSDKSRVLLNIILASAIQLSRPGSVEIALISPHLEKFPCPPEGAFAFSWAEPWERAALDLLQEHLAASGVHGVRPTDRIFRLLILDEVDRFLPYLDQMTRELLTWATLNGPAQGCRVIASAPSNASFASPEPLAPEGMFLSSFTRRIQGHHPASRSSQDPLAPQIHPAVHARDGYFSINLAGESIPFWLPIL